MINDKSHDETKPQMPVGLEISPFENDNQNQIGRDPRQMSVEDWRKVRVDFPVGLNAVRAKCLDCAYVPSEVRKCTCVSCPLWPLRMGSVPKNYRIAAKQAECEHAAD